MRQVLQPRIAFAEVAHTLRADGDREKLGDGGGCGRLGRSADRRRAFLCDSWVKATFSAELEFAARIVRRFYRGSFLGSAVTTRMVQFMRRSPVFRQLMGDLFSVTQDYSSLKRRLWGHLGITISEFIASVLNMDQPARATVPRAGTAGD